jgi:hypothetical protein
MTMEWITGVKLTTLPPDEIRDLVGVGQEAFLVQLLEVGFFHGDPHPGECRPPVVRLECALQCSQVARHGVVSRAEWHAATAEHCTAVVALGGVCRKHPC